MSFRKYGGTQFARSHNIVKSNVNTTDTFYVTKNVGQPNTYINFESDISGNVNIYGVLDVSGNLIVSGDADINGKLHVQEDIDCSGNVNIDGNIDCIGDITANEFFITGPIDSAPNSVVPKSYVDSVAVGLTPLAPCVLCSNVGNIPLTGHGQTIDGFTISSVYDGSFVLINAQGGVGVADITNGVYVVSSGTWLRPTELENGDKATGTAAGAVTTIKGHTLTLNSALNRFASAVGLGLIAFSCMAIPSLSEKCAVMGFSCLTMILAVK